MTPVSQWDRAIAVLMESALPALQRLLTALTPADGTRSRGA